MSTGLRGRFQCATRAQYGWKSRPSCPIDVDARTKGRKGDLKAAWTRVVRRTPFSSSAFVANRIAKRARTSKVWFCKRERPAVHLRCNKVSAIGCVELFGPLTFQNQVKVLIQDSGKVVSCSMRSNLTPIVDWRSLLQQRAAFGLVVQAAESQRDRDRCPCKRRTVQ